MDNKEIENSYKTLINNLRAYRGAMSKVMSIENISIPLPHSFETKSLSEWDAWAKQQIDYGYFKDVSDSALNVIYIINTKLQTLVNETINTMFLKIEAVIENYKNSLLSKEIDLTDKQEYIAEYIHNRNVITNNVLDNVKEKLEKCHTDYEDVCNVIDIAKNNLEMVELVKVHEEVEVPQPEPPEQQPEHSEQEKPEKPNEDDDLDLPEKE